MIVNTLPKALTSFREVGDFTRMTTFPDDWASYSKQLRENFWKLLGVRYDGELPLDFKLHNSFVHEGITVRNVSYQTRPGVYTTASIYIPQGEGPFPAVVNLHGHWIQGRLAQRVQSRGFTLAKYGYVVISPDAFGSGERSIVHTVYEHHGRIFGAQVFNLGETLMGCILVDNMRAVDVLTKLAEVDPERIGVTGASGGGNQTMYLAAMDERIKAAVPVCSVGTYESYLYKPNCCCETLPGGLKLTEMAGILALTAPRAMLICTGLYDVKTFSPQEMLRSYDAALPIYKKLGAWEKFTYRIFNHGHLYSPEVRQAMIGFFEFHLKGIGHGFPVAEKDFSVVDEERLLAFAPGTRPDEVCSLAAYLVRRGKEQLEQLYSRCEFNADDEKNRLAETIKFDAGADVAGVVEAYPEKNWRRFQLTLNNGTVLPVIFHEGEKDLIIYTHVGGKGEVPQAVVDQTIADGYAVALLDHSDQGELIEEDDRVLPYHQSARRSLWLGRTLVGSWSSELAAVIRFLNKIAPEKKITLHGCKENAMVALYTSVFTDKVSCVIMEDAPVSSAFNGVGKFFGMALPVPGILKWGDIPLAAALSNAELKWVTPRHHEGAPADVPTEKIEFIKQHLI